MKRIPTTSGLPVGSLLGVLNAGLGWVLLIGDPVRTSAPSFHIVREVLPVQVWGVLFLIGGVICALSERMGRNGAILVAMGGGIHACWASGLWQAVIADEKAALTAAWVYTWLALVHLGIGVRLARRVT